MYIYIYIYIYTYIPLPARPRESINHATLIIMFNATVLVGANIFFTRQVAWVVTIVLR